MKQVSEKLWIGAQPALSDFDELKGRGIDHIINNRPDGEEACQPTAREQAERAAALGLGYTHIPVTGGGITEDDVRQFQKALDETGGAALAHCKSGTRSLTLYAIGEVLDGRMDMNDLDALGERTGIKLDGAKNWLRANG